MRGQPKIGNDHVYRLNLRHPRSGTFCHLMTAEVAHSSKGQRPSVEDLGLQGPPEGLSVGSDPREVANGQRTAEFYKYLEAWSIERSFQELVCLHSTCWDLTFKPVS